MAAPYLKHPPKANGTVNYLGIDWGEKRIGLSFADELLVAVPLPAAVDAKKKERLAQIGSVIESRKVNELVVGYPLNMDSSVGFKARQVEAFVKELEARFQLPVHLADERLTTHQASQDTKGKKDDRKKGTLDSRAATLILQDFLDQQHPPAINDSLPDFEESDEE